MSLLGEMLRIRRFEEKCAELYSAGKIRGFLHLYIGEEAIAVGGCKALRPTDHMLTAYRDHGWAIARGLDPSVPHILEIEPVFDSAKAQELKLERTRGLGASVLGETVRRRWR